ncbi:O-antigen ligase family protein [Planctomicrobium piriforme]|uniref:O-Antigen ligase n=1 Tax=Planctomicrobium piriforme TaxID=1576369 RepID=A0A1I3CBI1_9PLAN|nr:O-antigen ligase family protein [Planctomicrobium piriforme]SFH71539.1 O-Antigen ligase [Planctomicrobium piriforme]
MIAYILFLLANAMLFMRPQEVLPALGDLQLYLPCIIGALLFSIHDLHNQLRWRTMLQQPVNLCVVGVCFAILTSRVFTGNFYHLDTSLSGMLKVVMYYMVLVSVITTPLRLRYFLMTTALCATFMIAYSVVDYRAFCRQWEGNPEFLVVLDQERNLDPSERRILRHIPDRDGVDVYGNEIWFFRLCGLGVFHDPNDISLLIVATTIISVYFLTDPKLTGIRYFWLIPIVIMGIAMVYTYSRGGILAFGVGGMAWLCTKYGTKVAMAIGLMCALAAPLALGRAGNIDVSEGTGQQRVQLWGDGLASIRNARLLFGIGEGVYPSVAGHVAHNSFVHAFVELGFFGGTLFMGCFFLPAFTFYLMKRNNFAISDPELRRMFPYIAAILAEWCMGMCSLSRCYVPPTYMIAGIAAAFINLVGFYRPNPKPLLRLTPRVVKPWIACSAGLLGAAYVFVRIFARWG